MALHSATIRECAQAWATIAIEVIKRPYPYSSGHLARGPQDVDITPQRLHPAFWGSLDWHSSVHMQWSLLHLLSNYPDDLQVETRRRALALLVDRLSAENLAVEVDYLSAHPGFERPYGWAWAAQLGAALQGSRLAELEPAAAAIQPLLDQIAQATHAWLPCQAYPVRHGKHQNDAFALTLLLDAFGRLERRDVCAAIESRVREWFGSDIDYQTTYEPSGSDFLSPALCEAMLVSRVLPEAEFEPWLAAFLPGWDTGGHPQLFAVPEVLDGNDGQFVHLRGLALSRAWQLRVLSARLGDEARMQIEAAAEAQGRSALSDIVEGDFMATHWLVSFALLAHGAGQEQ
ncbi:DUF2891 domain-containing protein [Ornithinimicrobium sp. Arc0846-15]|nr:DUF2891 domain-containing protein [Ornithinimicrobium laminariae]